MLFFSILGTQNPLFLGRLPKEEEEVVFLEETVFLSSYPDKVLEEAFLLLGGVAYAFRVTPFNSSHAFCDTATDKKKDAFMLFTAV